MRIAWRALIGETLVGRDPTYQVTRSGEERALRFIALLLILQRASYLVPTVIETGIANATYNSQLTNAVLLAVAVAWNVGLAVGVHRWGWFPRWTVGADVTLMCVLLAVSSVNHLSNEVFHNVNWASKLVWATAALVGAAVAPRWIPLVLLAPATAHLGMALVRFDAIPLSLDRLLNLLDSYFWWALIAYFMRRYLCAQGRALDQTTQRQLELNARRAAEQARFAERIAQYRTLHDTVLTTLTAIARGGLNHRTVEVRRRCATEADYVRRLIQQDASGTFNTLDARLSEVITAAESLGLRVHYLHDPLPADLPRGAVDGIADASREALNNVLTHSGTTEAWLTATWDSEVLLVRVVDRGRGFDENSVVLGFGIRSSIVERMHEAGGEATLSAMVHNGVCVDLVWPSAQISS
jgi:signal transduction histidine kinase